MPRYDSRLLCTYSCGYIQMWAQRQKLNPKIKKTRSHLKIFMKLTQICWRWLVIRVATSCRCVARYICGPHIKSWALELKILCSHIKIWVRLNKICCRWFNIAVWFFVQINAAMGPTLETQKWNELCIIWSTHFY